MTLAGIARGQEAVPASLVIHDEDVNRIDPRIFGQFLERASFGDPGPEAFVDLETGRLPDRILTLLEAMAIPLVRFHANRRLRADLSGVAIRPQPYRVGWGPPLDHVAVLDVLVTAGEHAVFVHAINRDFEREYPLEIDLRALGRLGPRQRTTPTPAPFGQSRASASAKAWCSSANARRPGSAHHGASPRP